MIQTREGAEAALESNTCLTHMKLFYIQVFQVIRLLEQGEPLLRDQLCILVFCLDFLTI